MYECLLTCVFVFTGCVCVCVLGGTQELYMCCVYMSMQDVQALCVNSPSIIFAAGRSRCTRCVQQVLCNDKLVYIIVHNAVPNDNPLVEMPEAK